jgi:hypothetical protein
LDFDTGKLTNFVAGRSTTLRTSDAQALVDCAERTLGKTTLGELKHGFSQYRVFYLIEFEPSGAVAPRAQAAEPSPTPAPSAAAPEDGTQVVGTSGRAVVVWETAIVRESPKTGTIVARILGGTKVMVTARQGDWYRVKYDGKGGEGWVYRESIGL